jgi:homoserine kinase type II
MAKALGSSATMAVLTAIAEEDARALLALYGLNNLETFEGLAAGSVNSNFSLTAGGTRLFLRVYEERDRAGAEHETAMVERLARAGVPTPAPIRRLSGGFVSDIGAKPAALFPWRAGTHRCQAGVTTADARRVGEALARVHVAGAGESCEEGRFRFADLGRRLDRIAASGDTRFTGLVPSLRDALTSAHAARDPSLPRGLTHGDLFRDNVLWDAGGGLLALLDFESACEGTFAYDLMVTILAWCVGDDLDLRLARAMREGYEEVRPLEERERRALAAEGSFGALRFVITRITDFSMRTTAAGPASMKDWKRFMMRFEKLRAMGVDGVQRALGA